MTLHEALATRAVRQYRRRDILTFVGLRHYLRSKSARRDRWANDVATEIVRRRTSGVYHKVYHYKERAEGGQFIYRHLHVPGPNECLAEAALIAACAEAGGKFTPLPCVYSYRLESFGEERGVFEPYYLGFCERHRHIAKACHENPNALVLYTDIRRFYPSVTVACALEKWNDACKASGLPSSWQELGGKLLREHGEVSDESPDAILTGPMLSHLVGNLVLHELDQVFSKRLPGRYFRYVDDIAVVVDASELDSVEAELKGAVNSLGLDLHPDKRMLVPASEWLDGEDDFENTPRPNWMTFIGQIHQLLLFHPDRRRELDKLMKTEGLRIPLLDYAEVSQGRDRLERLWDVFTEYKDWFARKMQRLEPYDIVSEALQLRKVYTDEAMEIFAGFSELEGFQRKRRVHRARFLTIRLAYLATLDDLVAMSDALLEIPELTAAGQIFRTVATGDATDLLVYGPSAAQAVCQARRASGGNVTLRPDWLDSALDLEQREATLQAFAILELNGIKIDGLKIGPPPEPMLQFCKWTSGSRSLLTSENLYFRELGSLHGIEDPNANRWALETAFDRDDLLVLDMQQALSTAESAS